MYNIKTIASVLNAKIIGNNESDISLISIDSRKIRLPESTLFFALIGNRDGHDFIPFLISKGVKFFVVSKDIDNKYEDDVCFLKVENTLKALQKLVGFHRSQFSYPLISITGSNGKTIVKEWLYQILNKDYVIVRNPKSYNSQVGVPLSIWGMHETANLAIFEAGISTVGEMDNLADMLKPDISILTSIGDAHDKGFISREQKVQEKLKLIKCSKVIICNLDDIEEYIDDSINGKLYSWSVKNNNASLYISNIDRKANYTTIEGIYNNEKNTITIPFNDIASINNAITCWLTCIVLGCCNETIKLKMLELYPIDMRLKVIKGYNHSTIINDSYNSDINSLEIALNFQNELNYQNKTLILSDFHQIGIDSYSLYNQVSLMLENYNISKIICIGTDIKTHLTLFKCDKEVYSSTSEFLEKINLDNYKNQAILIKGARYFEFERISNALELKIHDTVFEINLNSIGNNINYYRSKISKDTLIMAMVKAGAYGSGISDVALELQNYQIDYLAVAYADEGIELRGDNIKLPIMVMSPEVVAFDKMILNKLEPELYSFRILNEFISFLKYKNIKKYPVHIKIDTGMHRLGFDKSDVSALVNILKENKDVLKVVSVFSHLTSSEDIESKEFTYSQFDVFNDCCNVLKQNLGYSFIRHICNTAGIVNYPEAHYEMVRVGLGMYGIDSAVKNNRFLEPVAVLKTSIAQIKELDSSSTVGYNNRGVVNRKSRIATVKIGYADGFDRRLGNGVGEMIVNGKRARVIGNVCMDMTMIDVTDIDCYETDEVIVFNDDLRVEDIASKIGTIPYEILTSISSRVKRVYVRE